MSASNIPQLIQELRTKLDALEDAFTGAAQVFGGWSSSGKSIKKASKPNGVSRKSGGKRRARRSGEDKAKAIQAGVDKVVTALHGAKDGKKAEELVKLTGKKDWNAIVAQALKLKAVRKKGHKRATVYFTGKK